MEYHLKIMHGWVTQIKSTLGCYGDVATVNVAPRRVGEEVEPSVVYINHHGCVALVTGCLLGYCDVDWWLCQHDTRYFLTPTCASMWVYVGVGVGVCILCSDERSQ